MTLPQVAASSTFDRGVSVASCEWSSPRLGWILNTFGEGVDSQGDAQ